ncbi:MAG: hypothetical protein ABR549_18280 [Mycobacteriales bacterium]
MRPQTAGRLELVTDAVPDRPSQVKRPVTSYHVGDLGPSVEGWDLGDHRGHAPSLTASWST